MGAEHPAYWSLDKKDGMEKGYCCFQSNARDYARFGKLYMDSGKWNGKQLVPKEYVAASISPKLVNYYGYNWWITRIGKHYVPYTAGLFGQYVYVVADENMIVVRLGRLQTDDDDKNYVGAAIQMFGKKG